MAVGARIILTFFVFLLSRASFDKFHQHSMCYSLLLSALFNSGNSKTKLPASQRGWMSKKLLLFFLTVSRLTKLRYLFSQQGLMLS